MNARPTRGLSLRGKPATVAAPKPSQWELRVDFMAAISGTQLLAFQTLTATQRRMKGVKGWRKKPVLKFFRVRLAPKVRQEGLDDVRVVVDKALRIKPTEIREEMKKGGVTRMKPPVVLPASSAKFVSPLDNTLWHQLKERVGNRKPTTESGLCRILREEFYKITPEQLHNYYVHCALTRRSDPQKDL